MNNSNIADIIEQNSFDIKLNYARILCDHLLKTQPYNRESLKNFMVRIRTARESSLGIAKYTVDNVVNDMHHMLQSHNNDNAIHQPLPSTSGMTAMPPMLSPMSSATTVILDDENGTDIDENNDFDETVVSGHMQEIKILTTSLLESNSLQSLTKQSLFAFERLVSDDGLMYEDYFKDGIEIDSIDCDLNDNLQRFIKIFENYGPVRCVVTDVEYYAERVRDDPNTIDSLPPTVRAAVVAILDLVKNKRPYELEININPKEFNEISNVTVKALLNRYSEHKPIKFNVNNNVRNVADVSSGTDEEDVRQMTQTMRRKRKMRAAILNAAKSKKMSDQTTPSSTAAAAAVLSDEAFIDNVRQMHRSNVIVPKLIRQIVNVVPADVSSSLLTCPTNGLSDVRVSVQNYNTTISLINRMNLTAINENVYFYKLLEPLAYYGSSEELVTKVLWFVARAANYFMNGARNFNYLRDSLKSFTDDVDRVALFMIRYNFLWFYRQFLDKLLSTPTTPYQNRKIINVLHVYASVVQEEYNRIRYNFNQSRVYVGPVDNVIKLMVVSTSDILA